MEATGAAGSAVVDGSVPGAAAGDAGAAAQPRTADPAALYAQCRQRVEEPEAAGECAVDADCHTGGCSGEICAPAAALEGVMGACEVLPCFSVLDHCGCVEGRCTWSIKAEASAPPRVRLPDRLDAPTGG